MTAKIEEVDEDYRIRELKLEEGQTIFIGGVKVKIIKAKDGKAIMKVA